jgi:hypothetical protein
VEGLERLERVEPLETLTAAQRELLDGAIRNHPELASEILIVYRLQSGRALVAPQSEEISVGDPLICTGGWTETHSTASSDSDSSPDADLSVASAVADATPWLGPTE